MAIVASVFFASYLLTTERVRSGVDTLTLTTLAVTASAITYALGHLPATLTSVGLLAQAPLTALLAIPLLGEPLFVTQVIGGILVLTGIYVVNRR